MSRGFDSAWLREYENKSRPTRTPHAQQREFPPPLANQSEVEARGTDCPVVRFTLRRVQLLDVDAKYASVKDLLDGCRYAGVIRGDKEGEVRLEVEQEKVGSYAQEQTLIEIEYPCLP